MAFGAKFVGNIDALVVFVFGYWNDGVVEKTVGNWVEEIGFV